MTTRKTLLDRVEITSRCTADWNEMTGTDQVRYCSECCKYVYDLSSMTRQEAEALVGSRREQMCVRMIRDLEGKTLTVDALPPVRLLNWRPGPVASAVVSALISIAPAATAVAKQGRISARPGYSQNAAGHKQNGSVPSGATATIAGTVTDQLGAVMSGTMVTLIGEASGEVLSQITSEEGEFRFEGLPPRTYIVEVRAKGYRLAKQHDLDLKPGEARRVDVTMEREIAVMGVAAIPEQPLRTLYIQSDRVVVATVGKSIAPKGKDTYHLVKTELMVSKTIKGDGHKSTLDLYHWDYRDEFGTFKQGDTLLAFLQRGETDDEQTLTNSYELVYGSRSAKKLSEAELEIYLVRLEELKGLLNDPNSDPKDTVEWLVKCAEDPATRREGAFELTTSAWREVWEKQEARREAAELTPGIASSTTIQVPIPGSTGRKVRDPEPRYFALLTNEQKERLMNALLQSDDLVEGNFELIELAKQWKDGRLLPFLISYLRRVQETAPYSVQRVMGTAAELLDDEKVGNLVEDFRQNASYEDLETNEKENADLSEDADEDDAVVDKEAAEEEKEDETNSASDEETAKIKLTPQAARQARSAMLKQFLDAAEAKIKPGSPK